MRFRNENIGNMANIQQMFHCLKVKESHRNYLQIFGTLKGFNGQQMCIHVFRNGLSPAVATYGLQKKKLNFYLDMTFVALQNATLTYLCLVSCQFDKNTTSIVSGESIATTHILQKTWQRIYCLLFDLKIQHFYLLGKVFSYHEMA